MARSVTRCSIAWNTSSMSKRSVSVSESDGPRPEVLSVSRRRTGLPSSPFLEHSMAAEQSLTLPTDTDVWPSLPLEAWRDTYATLHMWMQVIGKIRLALAPMVSHWWQVTLYVTSRGLTTSPIPYGTRIFQIDFDFLDHKLLIQTADGGTLSLALAPRSVAEFYRETMAALRSLGIELSIWTTPVEVADRAPFEKDYKHAAYDPEYAQRCWRGLGPTNRVPTSLRSRLFRKGNPRHFFSGAFELAGTRISRRPAPTQPCPPHLAKFLAPEACS